MKAVTGLRNQSDGLPRPTTEKGLGWWGVLPPIRHGDQRWWLPLSDVAVVALGHALGNSSSAEDVDQRSAPELVHVLGADPPLQLFALLSWPGDRFVTVTELADWLGSESRTLFAGGDWILSAPPIQPVDQRHWSRLMTSARGTAPDQWIENATDWLQVLGPEVDANWRATWPSLIWDGNGAEQERSVLAGSKLLQRLARARERELITESCVSKLAEKRKTAAAKQLAYGLSHEINNPLANISARAQQLQHGEVDGDRSRSLEKIVEQVYRAHEMIAGLMFYANPPEPIPGEVNLNELAVEAVSDYQAMADELGTKLLLETSEDVTAEVDRMMFLEAIRVLIRNSIEAVGGGGTVVVSTELEEAGAGPHWLVHVADSGPGLNSEATAHAFDPFYSGREAGRGLGLGLCRAYRVAKLHHATVQLSGGLAGCVATLRLPI